MTAFESRGSDWSHKMVVRRRRESTRRLRGINDFSDLTPGAIRRASRASSGNIRQPDHVLANKIAGHKAERRPRAGEEWLAATKYDGVEVKSILINKTKVGQASCQVWSGNFNLPNWLCLQPTYHRLDVILDKRGVGSDRLQRARHNPLRLAPPRRREVVFLRAQSGLSSSQ